jgi:hypothetical protein
VTGWEGSYCLHIQSQAKQAGSRMTAVFESRLVHRLCWRFPWFSTALQENVGIVPRVGHYFFLPNSLIFIIHRSPYHLMLCRLHIDSVVNWLKIKVGTGRISKKWVKICRCKRWVEVVFHLLSVITNWCSLLMYLACWNIMVAICQ